MVDDDLFKTAPDPLIGRKLDGRYEVLGLLGEGGVGVVYRGRQAQLGRLVAIKVLRQDTAGSPEWRRRFEREARALSALAHPNVVPVTDSGIDRGVPFLVMELLQGKTLKDLIKEGPLPLGRALDITRQMLRGLAFAHGKGIVHRDLKPANVFLQTLPDHDDHVRLLDFGMVKFLEGSSARTAAELTRAGVIIGTPPYISPEQVKGVPADARTDVYAAGVLLFELLAGRRPFIADSAEGYIEAHVSQPVPSLAKLRPGAVSAPLFQPVIERAMSKKPAGRFKDAAAMLAALEEISSKLPIAALSEGHVEVRRKPTPRAHRPSGLRYWRHALALVALATGIAAVEIHLRRGRAKPVVATVRPAQPSRAPAPATPTPPPRPVVPAEPALATAPPSPPPASSPPPPSAKPETAPSPPPASSPPPPSAKPETAPPPSPASSPPPPSPEPAPPAAAEAPAPAPVPVEEPGQRKPPPEAEAKGPREARDPWREPVPHALRPILERVNRGARMSQRALAPAYELAHQSPDDPRPWLLLGRAYARLDWLSDSVERYVHAYRIDSTCRGDPQMLADLLKAAAHPVAGPSAARAVRDIYGAEAIAALEKEREHRAGDREAIARLTRLRESLSR